MGPELDHCIPSLTHSDAVETWLILAVEDANSKAVEVAFADVEIVACLYFV